MKSTKKKMSFKDGIKYVFYDWETRYLLRLLVIVLPILMISSSSIGYYLKNGGDYTALIGGFGINFATLFISLFIIEIYLQIVARAHEKDKKLSKEKMFEILGQEEYEKYMKYLQKYSEDEETK